MVDNVLLSQSTSGESCGRRSAAFGNKISASAGVNVSATPSDARIATMYASARGWKNAPDKPSESKHRHEHERDDQAAEYHGAAHFQRRLEDDRKHGLRITGRAVAPQAGA